MIRNEFFIDIEVGDSSSTCVCSFALSARPGNLALLRRPPPALVAALDRLSVAERAKDWLIDCCWSGPCVRRIENLDFLGESTGVKRRDYRRPG